jgi:hypothetical protein
MMDKEQALELLGAMKDYINDETVFYPIVSFMCRNGYFEEWEVRNDVDFYVHGEFIV